MDQSIELGQKEVIKPIKLTNYKMSLIQKDKTSLKRLKQFIWLYLILLIFEGALRKWVLPGLATPLLVARDPVAVILIIMAWRNGFLGRNIYVTIMVLVSILALFTALFAGHGNLVVALYGVRTLVLHFPVIFIIGNVFDRDDVIKIGKFIVWVTIPITVLLISQFYSPQSAWVNKGIGGDTIQGFQGALGFFRPSATFSFSNGTALFYSFAACFIFYFWLSPNKSVNKLLLISASTALAMSIPLSISRSLLFFILVTVGFIIIGVSRTPRSMFRIILITFAVIGLFALLSQVSIFQTATEALTTRFTQASDSEGGLQGTLGSRYIGGLANSFDSDYNRNGEIPLFGYGIGMGTNVGSQLLTGKVDFLIAEGEWGRLIGEMGLFMGITVIVIRIMVCVKLGMASFKRLKFGDFLPWILLSYCLLTLPQGQWSQPTSLGFSIIAGGLTLAALRIPAPPKLQPVGK
jgi:hypothetical protein